MCCTALDRKQLMMGEGINWREQIDGTYRVEQNVGGLEVAVDHRRLGFVQERQPLGGADGDLEPRRPWQGRKQVCNHTKVNS